MWVANVANVAGVNQTAVVSADSTVYQLTVSGTPTAALTVRINSGATLTTFGETLIEAGGRIELVGGTPDPKNWMKTNQAKPTDSAGAVVGDTH